MDDRVKVEEERATERALMRIDAEADIWLAEAPEFRTMIRLMSSLVAGPFKERAAAQLDTMIRNTFVEAYYRGFNAHKDGAAAVVAARASDTGRSEAMREACAIVALRTSDDLGEPAIGVRVATAIRALQPGDRGHG